MMSTMRTIGKEVPHTDPHAGPADLAYPRK